MGEKIELQHETGNWPLIKEEGFSPVQITVAAVAACSAYVYAKLLDKKRIPYEDLDVDVSYEQDLEQAVHVIKKNRCKLPSESSEKNIKKRLKKRFILSKMVARLPEVCIQIFKLRNMSHFFKKVGACLLFYFSASS
ncbi:OsmC family protein [Listeria fleischmannii]|uniref:OsmC/Ohr family protein n=1 Tax=Listeria fleischmannii FSL S10-1203 TaxID=1265822 RepID=W7DMZ7_9LIST|nr:OsmC family protein [Listeria fleischmannii]EUJ58934.1 OsmC/Ohr family protein [Listeria fleischmannii FSL S10-1203]